MMGLLLRSATLASGSTCAGVRLTGPVTADVRVDGEWVAWIDPPGTLSPAPGDAVHDLGGYLLLPAPVEPHTHLDTALLAEQVQVPGGDPGLAAAAMRTAAAGVTRQDVLHRARRAAQLYLAHGATAVRTHVDVGGAAGTRHLEALLQLRDELRGLLTLQLVALPAGPLTGSAGAQNAALLREALAQGADLAGGAPGYDPDPPAALETCLAAAADAGAGADLHLDLPGEPDRSPGDWGLAELAAQVRASGFDLPVTVAACGGLTPRGNTSAAPADRLAAAVAAADISVVVLPQTGLYLTGRGSQWPPSPAGHAGLGAVDALLTAGVTVAAGGDHLRNPFNPMGRADPLETASLLVTAGHLTADEAYTRISAAARTVMGLSRVPERGVLVNDVPAELLAVRAVSLADALAAADADRTVISAGRVAVRTRVTRSFPLQPSRA